MRIRCHKRRLLAAFLAVCPAAGVVASASDAPVGFNNDIRPILSDRCYACHGPDASNRKTALRFDTEQGAFAPLASGGYAIVRGKPGESFLYQRITSGDPVRRMPPAYEGHEKLPAGDIELIRRWIEQGAEWQSHWSFIRPKRTYLPPVSSTTWPRNGIDHFLLARLEREGLAPSGEADKTTLIRSRPHDRSRGFPGRKPGWRACLRYPSTIAVTSFSTSAQSTVNSSSRLQVSSEAIRNAKLAQEDLRDGPGAFPPGTWSPRNGPRVQRGSGGMGDSVGRKLSSRSLILSQTRKNGLFTPATRKEAVASSIPRESWSQARPAGSILEVGKGPGAAAA